MRSSRKPVRQALQESQGTINTIPSPLAKNCICPFQKAAVKEHLAPSMTHQARAESRPEGALGLGVGLREGPEEEQEAEMEPSWGRQPRRAVGGPISLRPNMKNKPVTGPAPTSATTKQPNCSRTFDHMGSRAE